MRSSLVSKTKLTESEALGLIEILQLVVSHPNRIDYVDADLMAAITWINKQLIERRI